MNTKIDALLNTCVKKSLGYNIEEANKMSIVECAHNDYLDPEYDAFQDLKGRLELEAFMERYKMQRANERRSS